MAERKTKETAPIKKFYKSRKDRMIDGVCGGFAEYLGADATVVRILWVLSVFLHGVGIIAYILAMIFVPVNPTHKNLKESERKKMNPGLIWGTVLIVLGFLFLYHEWGYYYRWNFPFRFQLFPWWRVPWDFLWPLVVVFLGIVYIIYVLRKEKRPAVPKREERKSERHEGKRLYRTAGDKMIGGVCGGLGRYFQVDSTLIRIGFAVLAILTNGLVWVIVYVVLLVALPQEEVGEVKAGK